MITTAWLYTTKSQSFFKVSTPFIHSRKENNLSWVVWISIGALQIFHEIFQPKTNIAVGTKKLQGKAKCLKGGMGLSLLRSRCLVLSCNALLNVHHVHTNSCLSMTTDGIHSPRKFTWAQNSSCAMLPGDGLPGSIFASICRWPLRAITP